MDELATGNPILLFLRVNVSRLLSAIYFRVILKVNIMAKINT
jgi:hypothetical protein